METTLITLILSFTVIQIVKMHYTYLNNKLSEPQHPADECQTETEIIV